ncbi:MAG: type II secretion system protein [Deltaproteobacteria bacterium]|nr:type II secretion system protein [Deltaproteobacteria bacterium]
MNGKEASGFTLIELMISMTILSFIAMTVYQTTSRSFELRETLSQDGDFYNAIRVALETFGRDVTHIYTPQAASLPGEMGKPAKPGSEAAAALSPSVYPFWGALINSHGVRPSRFNGSDTKISFVINSHVRLFRDSAESEFAKITYALEEDKLAGGNVLALVKRENPNAFTLEEKLSDDDEIRYTLISGVKGLRLRYLDGEKDSWSSSWDTTSSDHLGKFPSLVEIELEMELPKSGNTFTAQQRYRTELAL